MPELATRIANRSPYIARGPGGTVNGWMHDGEFKVASVKLPDGSLIVPTEEADGHLKRLLFKDGASANMIEKAASKFSRASENEIVELNESTHAVKWSIEKVEPDLANARQLSDVAVLKIAFEFLAGLIGGVILGEHPAIGSLRSVLAQSNCVESAGYKVVRAHANSSRLFHGICFEGNFPHAIIQIRLFGTIAYRVHFERIAVDHPILEYTHDLESQREWLQSANSPR